MVNYIKEKSRKSKKAVNPVKLPVHLEHININAAGIDIGSGSHYVAVPEGCTEEPVREFKSFTADLYKLANWLKECKITTVAMESTGVYWIPLYELLESKGFEVKLVDARKVKNVSGRKTDVLDCQWLQRLHTYGLLSGALRPKEQVCILRTYIRQRNMLVESASKHIQHMQKALSQMNIQLHNVLSDITGKVGLAIIRDIVSGEKDPKKLAAHRNNCCKQPIEIIEKSLEGNYRVEHLFSLTQALELYDEFQKRIIACDRKIEEQLLTFERHWLIMEDTDNEVPRRKKNSHTKNKLSFNAAVHLKKICGVDLTEIPGIEASSALKIVSEIGFDMTFWKNGKCFASWLGLCPGNKVSGGKRLSGKSKRCSNNAAAALRMAANTLHSSQTALGAYYRRLRARLGAPKAITAAAHKLALIIYNMLKNGEEYIEAGQDYYEKQYQERIITNLSRRAKTLGYELVDCATGELPAS